MKTIVFALFLALFFIGCGDDSSNGDNKDACEDVTCSDHGLCKLDASKEAYCECSSGYSPGSSLTCVQDVDPCDGINCSNKGVCKVDGQKKAYCDCEDGFVEGANLTCEEDVNNICDGIDCGGKGVCKPVDNKPTCRCEAGSMEDPKDALNCVNDPCFNQLCSGLGVCEVAEEGWAECNCKPGYTEGPGLSCIAVSDTLCKDVDCGEGACKVKDDKAYCDCDTGYHQDDENLVCVRDANSCDDVDCVFGSCKLKDGAAYCDCGAGYKQESASSLVCVPICQDVECSGHGECEIVNNAPSCDCDTDYVNGSGDALTCILNPNINFVNPSDEPTKSAVIITSDAMKPHFERLAMLHTLTGLPTEVVAVESEICTTGKCNDSDATNDTAKAIKDFLIARKAADANFKYVLIGGDIEDVPSRLTYDAIDMSIVVGENTLYPADYDGKFYTDYYYANLKEWDSNGNGVYAERDVDDLSGQVAYAPDLSVSRLPVSNETEFNNYFNKAQSYVTNYNLANRGKALLTTNNAMTVDLTDFLDPAYFDENASFPNVAYFVTLALNSFNIDYKNVPVDSSLYFMLPEGEGARTRGKELLTNAGITPVEVFSSKVDDPTAFLTAQTTQIEKGPNFIYHLGHGSEKSLMTEQSVSDRRFDKDMALALENDNYPIFLSCACQAGTFACGSAAHSEGTLRACSEWDSAGENLVNAPNGGAIVYLGNVITGLGIAGGNQLMDEFLRYALDANRTNNSTPLIADALFSAHDNLLTSESLEIDEDFIAGLLPESWNQEFTKTFDTLSLVITWNPLYGGTASVPNPIYPVGPEFIVTPLPSIITLLETTIQSLVGTKIVNIQSHEWTQKVATMLGDHMLPLYNNKMTIAVAPGVTVTAAPIDTRGTLITVDLDKGVDGKLMFKTDNGNYFEASINNFETHYSFAIEETPDAISIGVTSNGNLPAFKEINF